MFCFQAKRPKKILWGGGGNSDIFAFSFHFKDKANNHFLPKRVRASPHPNNIITRHTKTLGNFFVGVLKKIKKIEIKVLFKSYYMLILNIPHFNHIRRNLYFSEHRIDVIRFLLSMTTIENIRRREI